MDVHLLYNRYPPRSLPGDSPDFISQLYLAAVEKNPDFSPQLRDKIWGVTWEWPGNEVIANVYVLIGSKAGGTKGKQLKPLR